MSFDIPKQFGDPQWSSKYQQQKNIGNERENREVNNGVKKQDTGAFRDLESLMKASKYYINQREKAGKLTEEQMTTIYTEWLNMHPDRNLLTDMRKYQEATRSIEAH